MDPIEEAFDGVGLTPSQKMQLRRNIKMADTAGKLNVSGDRRQSVLDLKIAQYKKAGVVTSQSFLRAEYPLTSALNTINFNVLASGNGIVNGENIVSQNLLNQNDTFTVMGYCIYIKKAVAVGGAVPTDAEQVKAQLHTFPNPVVFPVAGEAAALEAIYNGELSIQLDTTNFVPSFPVRAMYRVPQSQQGVGAATGVTGVQRDEWPVPMYGKVEAQPSFEFSGQTQLGIQVNLNASVDMSSGAATSRNYAVLILTGYLHSGATNEFQKRQSVAQKA